VDRYGIDPEKIEVIYQSCQPLFYEPLTAPPDNEVLRHYNLPSQYLLYVGSVTERKNLGVVIDAYEQLAPGERIPWVIVGKGKKHRHALAQRIAEKQLDRWVIWIDDLADNYRLKTLYQHASALIYPSLYEGFGLPVVEALLSKTPVITSNTSSLPEAGGPHSVYVAPNQADEVAHALRQVLNNTELRKTMKEEGYRYATENFSRQRVTEKLKILYQTILRNSQTR
jgi:glycosyltransferase involved in cell wall biosynthesis